MIEIGSNSQLSNKDRSYLHLAMKVAESSVYEMRHGAVVVRGGSVLAVGYNKQKNDPIIFGDAGSEEAQRNSTVHAEMDALSRVTSAKGAVVYVARINRRGEPVLSRPCDNCYESLRDAGVKKIIFTEARHK